MLWRVKLAVYAALVLIAGLAVSASCSALNEADDFAVTLGVVGLLAVFVLFPWMSVKLFNWKGKTHA